MTTYNIAANLAGAGNIPVGGGVSSTGLQVWYPFDSESLLPIVDLLMHFDGDYSDASGRHTAITPTASATTIDTTNYKFGTGSFVDTNLNATGNVAITDNLGDFTFAGDFTIDCWWLYPSGGTGWSGAGLFDIGNTTLQILQNYYWTGSVNVQVITANIGTLNLTDTVALVAGWNHIALTRQGSTVRLFKNGTLVASGTYSGTLTPTGGAYVGSSQSGYPAQGNIDELRVINGTAIWTSNFTPPSAPYVIAAGTTPDTSGNANTGQFMGSPAPTLTAGHAGQAVTFNGGNARVNLPSYAVGLTSPTGSFTAMGWVKTTPQSAIILGGRSVANGSPIINLVTDYNGYDNGYTGYASMLVRDNSGSGLTSIKGTTALNDNNWHHVCGVFDGSGGVGNQVMWLYVDGVLQAGPVTTPLTAGITLDNIASNIGYEYQNGYATTGSVDDFRFYTRALSASEVASVYTGATGTQIVNQVMVGQSKVAGAGGLSPNMRQFRALSANWTGTGALSSQANRNIMASATWTGLGNMPTAVVQKAGLILIANFAGAGNLAPVSLRRWIASTAFLGGSGGVSATAAARFNVQPFFAGAGGTNLVLSQVQNMAAELAGGGGIGLTIPPYQWVAQAAWGGTGAMTVWLDWLGSDNINPGILEDAGEQLLYRNASGLEKSLATIDGYRLTVTYAELVRDQWDPWAISYRNLGYLAWAQGVNLWEDDWTEQFRRWWVANQWTFKYYRGSDLGLKMAVEAVNGKIVRLTRPPALFYPGAELTAAERAAYVARFPQLRLYPYAPRPQLPWLDYVHGTTYKQGVTYYAQNGYFLGPIRKFYPTNFNAGGLYLRVCTVYDPLTGVETNCTVRRVYGVLAGSQSPIYYDEVTLPAGHDNHFYPGAGNKFYLLQKNYSLAKTRRHAVVLGVIDSTPQRLIRVPRDGSLDITQYQAIFQTIAPSLNPLQVRPEWVYIEHPWHKYQFYCNRTIGPKRFLCKSDAWMYLYERWYLFDPTRLPDYRRANTYMGRSRFGIRKYSAEAKIAAFFPWPRRYSYYGSFMGPGRFFAPQNTKRIEQLRRAVAASMAARDTVAINTRVMRQIQVRDVTVLDGRYSVGQWITDSS